MSDELKNKFSLKNIEDEQDEERDSSSHHVPFQSIQKASTIFSLSREDSNPAFEEEATIIESQENLISLLDNAKPKKNLNNVQTPSTQFQTNEATVILDENQVIEKELNQKNIFDQSNPNISMKEVSDRLFNSKSHKASDLQIEPLTTNYDELFKDDGNVVEDDKDLDIPDPSFQSEFDEQSFGFTEPGDFKKDDLKSPLEAQVKDHKVIVEQQTNANKNNKFQKKNAQHGNENAINNKFSAKDNPTKYTTMVELAQADLYNTKRKYYFLAVILLTFAGGGFFYQTNNEFKLSADKLIKTGLNYVNIQESQEPELASPQIVKTNSKNSNFKSDLIEKISKMNCKEIIDDSTKFMKSKLNLDSALKLSGCYMANEDFDAANSILNNIKITLKKSHESKINLSESLSHAYFQWVFLSIKQGRLEESRTITKEKCPIEKASKTCLIKLFFDINSQPKSVTTNRLKYFQSNSLNDNFSLTLASLVNGIYYGNSLSNRFSGHFQQSLEQSPEITHWLWKYTIETGSLYFYKLRDKNSISKLIKKNENRMSYFDSKSNWKIYFLKDLSDSEKEKATLKKFLSRQEFINLAKKDYRLVHELGFLALIHNTSKDFNKLLMLTIDHFKIKERSSNHIINELQMWSIRDKIHQEKYQEALKLIASQKNLYGNSTELAHFEGVCYLYSSNNVKFQLLASKSFKEAFELNANWESLVGLGLSLIRAEKLASAKKVLTSLNNYTNFDDLKKWHKILEAEYLLKANNLNNALVTINKTLLSYPNSAFGWETKSLILKKLFKKNESEIANNKAQELFSSQRLIKSGEIYSSPIGPLAHFNQ